MRSLLTDELRARLDDPDSVLPDDATQVVSLLAISDNGTEMRTDDTRPFMALCSIAQHFGRPSTPTDQASIFIGDIACVVTGIIDDVARNPDLLLSITIPTSTEQHDIGTDAPHLRRSHGCRLGVTWATSRAHPWRGLVVLGAVLEIGSPSALTGLRPHSDRCNVRPDADTLSTASTPEVEDLS